MMPLVSLIGHLIACSTRISVNRQTDRTTTVTLAVHARRGLKSMSHTNVIFMSDQSLPYDTKNKEWYQHYNIHIVTWKLRHQDLSWSRAIWIWSAISKSLLFLRVAMRLSHDTSTPLPASHFLRTSIVTFSGSLINSSLIRAILSPVSSSRSKTPNVSNLSPTRRGKSIVSSCGRVGREPETGGDRKTSNIHLHFYFYEYGRPQN